MSGLPWFELDVDFHKHPKTRALQVKLKNPLAEAYISRIWAHCYRQAVDRFHEDVAAATLEEEAGWKGKSGHLMAVLLEVGYLRREGEVVVAHGVQERLAPHLAQRQAAAERQRRRRDKAAAAIGRHAGVTAAVTRDVPRESQPDTDKDRDKDTDKEAEADGGGSLHAFRQKLAAALNAPTVRIGKNADRTVASFARWLDRDLEEVLLDDCVRLAREKGVTPSSLAWWPGWLDTVSDKELNRLAAQGSTGGA